MRLWGPVEPCPTPVLFHSAATRACCPFLAVQASFVKKQQQENVVVVWVVFFFPSPLKLCVVLRIWHRLYSKSLHLEQPQCELGASHCLILMQPKEGLGRGKWSRKVAKEAQGHPSAHAGCSGYSMWTGEGWVNWGDPSYFFNLHPKVFKPNTGMAGGGSSWCSLSWSNLANCFVKHQRVLQNPFPLVHWGFCWADHVY